MSVMTDESLAFNVAEATMQDWMAAVMLAERTAVPRFATGSRSAHPMVLRPSVARPSAVYPVSAGVRRRVVPAPVAGKATSSCVAGARVAYWVLLAGALAVFVLL